LALALDLRASMCSASFSRSMVVFSSATRAFVTSLWLPSLSPSCAAASSALSSTSLGSCDEEGCVGLGDGDGVHHRWLGLDNCDSKNCMEVEGE
jgi:hypothetical protein